MIKKSVKRLLQLLITSIGPARLNFSTKKRLIILMYHRVLPITHPDIKFEQPGMYVHPDTFKMHMQILKNDYEITHLSDWLHKNNNNQDLPKLSFAITFDDGWKDNFEYAMPIMQELEIPATIFLVSDYLGSNYSFWPNRLSCLLNDSRISSSLESKEYAWLKSLLLNFNIENTQHLSSLQIDEIIEQCKTKSDSEMISNIESMEKISSVNNLVSSENILSHAEVKEMVGTGLIHIGSHTRHHARLLNSLSESELKDEIIGSKSILEKICGNQVDLFCYPNGNYTDKAVNNVRRHYLAAVTTKYGWNDTTSDPYLLRRIGLHEDVSKDEVSFISRISGLK